MLRHSFLWQAPAGKPGSQRLVVTQAKKGSKGAQKKGGGALADLLKKKEQTGQTVAHQDAGDELATPDQYKDPEVVMQLMMICQSYQKQYNE